MYISTNTIKGILNSWHAKSYGREDVFFFREYCMVGDLGEHDDTTILLLNESDYRRKRDIYHVAAFIVIREDDAWDPGWESQDTPFVVIDKDARQDQVLDCLRQNYYRQVSVCAEKKTKLLRIMSSGGSLQSILVAATREMENPFIVYDNNYALIAHSVPRTLAVPPAQNVVKNGYANVDVILEMEKEGLLDYVFANRDHPVLVKIVNGYQKLAVSIYNHENYVGLLCFFDYVRPIREEDYEMVEFIGQLTHVYFHNQPAQTSNWTPWDYLFSTILKQKQPIGEADLKGLEIDIPKEMRLFAVSAAGAFHSMQGNQLKYFQTLLRSRLPSSHQFFVDDFLICLDSSDRLDFSKNVELWDYLQREMEKLNVVGGMSNPFYRIEKLELAYHQAIAAIRIGQQRTQDGKITEYQTFLIPHMLMLLNQKYAVEDFYHPALISLIRYDQQYRTNYTEFLLVYLLCGRNSNLCAECFSIHYNSVKYRLNVIQDVCGINLKNYNSVMNLYISCQIYIMKNPDFLKKYASYIQKEPDNL